MSGGAAVAVEAHSRPGIPLMENPRRGLGPRRGLSSEDVMIEALASRGLLVLIHRE